MFFTYHILSPCIRIQNFNWNYNQIFYSVRLVQNNVKLDESTKGCHFEINDSFLYNTDYFFIRNKNTIFCQHPKPNAIVHLHLPSIVQQVYILVRNGYGHLYLEQKS